MTAFMIRPRDSLPTPKSKAKKNGDYLAFIRQLPCAVTGVMGVEAAHLSFAFHVLGHYGRGKGTKVSDRWTLPLCPDEHRRQHSMDEATYWSSTTSRDPHVLCLILWGLWTEYGDDAEPYASDIIRRGVFLDRTEKYA